MNARWTHRAQACWPLAAASLLLGCALLPLAGKASFADAVAGISPAAVGRAVPPREWPREWRGQALQPLARSAVEARFAERFPGRIARFRVADSGDELVLREVQRPTRMLHPAADCWRGIGWQVAAAGLVREDDGTDGDDLWRCFEATHSGQRVRICERIVDARGQVFTDTSAWFWAASLGQSVGPWLALTHVQGLGSV